MTVATTEHGGIGGFRQPRIGGAATTSPPPRPRLIPKRGQVVRNAMHTLFSCFLPHRTVSPIDDTLVI
nr:hypothetical protein Iba_chr05aCG11350 [Ipomoea batatas]GME20882.1 hypothetical protein Iba_scaffold26338CG0010 [Ipomoea batatas]